MIPLRAAALALVSSALLGLAAAPVSGAPETAAALGKVYAQAIQRVNEEHARRPGKTTEAELAGRVPRPARGALDRLLAMKDSPQVLDALVVCGEAALDLDLIDDFQKAAERLAKTSPAHAEKLGIALSRPRAVLRGLGGTQPAYLEEFAAVLDAVLSGYDEVFGFEEWSKVPGKKLRVKIHIEKDEAKPPHFAPQFPFHSEIDFPVEDGTAFRSPHPGGSSSSTASVTSWGTSSRCGGRGSSPGGALTRTTTRGRTTRGS